MKRYVLAAFAVAAALTGCGGGHAAAPASPPAPSATASLNVIDDTFLQFVRPYFSAATSDATLVKLGHSICEDLTKGMSSSVISTGLADSTGMDGTMSSLFIGASEGAYCPNVPADQ